MNSSQCPFPVVFLQVNGFEVHDPEEAILLFLEQDQDITLTVARPVKVQICVELGIKLASVTCQV